MIRELAIHGLGPQGDGVAGAGPERVYVEGALPGETVRADVARAGDVMRGALREVLSASPHRVAAPCVHYDVCGGCTLQHADAAFIGEWKVNFVKDALARQGLSPAHWGEPVLVPAGRRRRVTFAAVRGREGLTLGYARRRSHQLTDIGPCLVASPDVLAVRDALRLDLGALLQPGKAADVFIQTVGRQSDVVITGPVGAKGRPDLGVFEAAPRVAHAGKLSRLSWRAREQDEPEVLVEREPVRTRFGTLEVTLPPLAFLQPTAEGEAALVAALMALLPAKGRFADLFAGCGTFSGPMLAHGSVDAFEIATAAVRALDKARGARPLTPAQRDLFRKPLAAEELARYDAVVFDPPRAGAEAQSRALAASKVKRIIGISCNPITFARDARLLADGGYRLDTVTVIDQFTWSHHVELVAGFAR